jgi:hypothetical protein
MDSAIGSSKWRCCMVHKKTRWYVLIASLLMIIVGATLALCSRPIFTFTRDDGIKEIPRSETIMNYSFTIHQSRDKLAQFQITIGQKLNISATGNGNFNFSIANFTDPSHLEQPDQPDLVYLSLDNTDSVNTTWSPVIRTAEPGSYYLIFLARNASVESPVQIVANVTKTWTDIQTIRVQYKGSLLDSSFLYVGSAIVILGGAISLIAFFSRPPSRKQTGSRRKAAGRSQRSTRALALHV